MRKLFVLFFCLLSVQVSAAESYSFVFESVKLTDLSKVVFADMLGKSFVFDSAFMADSKTVTFNLKDVGRREVLSSLLAVLDSNGFEVDQSGRVFHVIKKRQPILEDLEVFFYRPRFRSVSYLSGLLGSVFKGKFTVQAAPVAAAPLPNNGTPLNGTVPNSGMGYQAVPAAGAPGDKDKDAFLFEGTAKEIEKLKKLLVMADTSAGQLLVRTHVYEVTTGAKEGSAFALAMNLISKGSPGSAGKTDWRYQIGDAAANLGNLVSWKNATLEGVFSVLASDSRFKVVSSPSLRVKHGNNARFSVGSDVPVLGSIQMDKNGNPIQSVEYKPSGVILDVQPRIMGDEIELTINQQLSSFVVTTTGVNNSPTLTKREIKTTIGAVDGDVIVLGGLDESKSSGDSAGLPYVPRFLRSSGSEDSKTELMLVMEVQKI